MTSAGARTHLSHHHIAQMAHQQRGGIGQIMPACVDFLNELEQTRRVSGKHRRGQIKNGLAIDHAEGVCDRLVVSPSPA